MPLQLLEQALLFIQREFQIRSYVLQHISELVLLVVSSFERRV